MKQRRPLSQNRYFSGEPNHFWRVSFSPLFILNERYSSDLADFGIAPDSIRAESNETHDRYVGPIVTAKINLENVTSALKKNHVFQYEFFQLKSERVGVRKKSMNFIIPDLLLQTPNFERPKIVLNLFPKARKH